MSNITDNTIDLDQLFAEGKELPEIAPAPGERWFPLETRLEDDLKDYWGGDWGCSSEVSRLRAVLLCRPGKEIESFDHEKVRFRSQIDPEKFRAQHDLLADYYRSQGVAVYYIENGRIDRPNAVFVRDRIFMTPEGAIITRMSMPERRGEERYVTEAVAKLGIPIVKTISADGIFEGANAMWVDRHTVILSLSVRANQSGYNQMVDAHKLQGVTDFITMQIPYGHAHVDGLMNFVREDLVLVHAMQVPYVVVDALKKKGIQILETNSMTEAKYGYSTNFVAIEPGHVVTSNKSPKTVELLEKHGVKVDVLDLSELNKGRGSVHCMTSFLKRDKN